MLVRLFFTFRETELVIVLAGYDKLRDPPLKRQRYEIEAANNLLAALDSNYGMY